jgi:hypothetical protein
LKLVKQADTSFTFHIGKRERDLFIALLLRYPVLSSAHFNKRQPEQGSGLASDDSLLAEALGDQQKESRKHLEEWLKAEGRFQETDPGFNFTLSSAEVEWILQVLNDIRVGSWVALGEPDGKTPISEPLTENTMQLAWALEMAGHFQHIFLSSLDPIGPPEPAAPSE